MDSEDSSLYLPQNGQPLSVEDVWRWLSNIPKELALLNLTPTEQACLTTYYKEAGLLTRWKRAFFRHHYATPLFLALRRLFARGDRPRILDLGAGSGTQSLLFALLGAEVIAVDLDTEALRVLEKRKKLYERLTRQRLAITVRNSNAFDLEWASLGPFSGLYSLFAFNMMQPSQALLAQLAPHFAPACVVAIQDGNRLHFFNRLFRKRSVLSRAELATALRRLGFEDVRHVGGYAIPPPFWTVVPTSILSPLDRALTKLETLAVSYLHIARRGD